MTTIHDFLETPLLPEPWSVLDYILSKHRKKEGVDAYDEFNERGLMFCSQPITAEDIQKTDEQTHLDWIFNVQSQFLRHVTISGLLVCEVPSYWNDAITAVKHDVYLFTGFKEWIYLETKETYCIEIDDVRRNVWIGKTKSFRDVFKGTCLQNMLNKDGIRYFNSLKTPMETVVTMHARCVKSMYLLDSIHREAIQKHIFRPNEVVAVKSVAGSGKTTTLLNLAKVHAGKRILYLAFNRSLIEEIRSKLKLQHISNMYPCTFDSLLVNTYCFIKRSEPTIGYLTPQTIQEHIPWLRGKAFRLRKDLCMLYKRFCKQIKYDTPEEFCKAEVGKAKPLLSTLWEKTLAGELNTFEGFRKVSLLQHWFKNYIDRNYDMIFVDETQDFDLMMLRMLLDDTSIPKLFVGDPKQSIYQWRGCINGFEYMPTGSLLLEFYSTFRIGEPACSAIRAKFNNCWMISKSSNETELSSDLAFEEDVPYTYLFRTWKQLLKTAETMPRVWIAGYTKKMETIRKQHEIIHNGYTMDDEEFEDDLPKFLKSVNQEQLNGMISNIESNLVEKESAVCKFYTVHSYKGLEDDNIRLAGDIGGDEEEDKNVYYVALTRGLKYILEDERIPSAMPTSKPSHTFGKTPTSNILQSFAYVPTLPKNSLISWDFPELEMPPLPKKTARKQGSLMFPGMAKERGPKTEAVSLGLFLEGKSVDEIARVRDMAVATILDHLLLNIPHERITYDKFMTELEYLEIQRAIVAVDYTKLKTIKEHVAAHISYDKIKIARKLIRGI